MRERSNWEIKLKVNNRDTRKRYGSQRGGECRCVRKSRINGEEWVEKGFGVNKNSMNRYFLKGLLIAVMMCIPGHINWNLKVVSATFLPVYFLSLNEISCQTRKNTFCFTSKALFVHQKIKFWYFRFSNFMTSSNASA